MEGLSSKRRNVNNTAEIRANDKLVTIGEHLKQLRLAQSYSQEYLAHVLNMTQGNYCKLESGYHFPSTETLKKIASLYELSLQDVLGLNGVKKTENEVNKITDFITSHDFQKLVEELLSSKDKIIGLQAKRIEVLERQLLKKKK